MKVNLFLFSCLFLLLSPFMVIHAAGVKCNAIN